MANREKFASRLGFILVSAGCAIGIGNVWKFPYICGMYGGAGFIVMYLAFLIILGLPILVCEFTVGRGSGLGMGKAFEKLEPEGTKWHVFKWISILGSFLLMMFYTMVGGWMLYYAYLELTGKMTGLDADGVANVFSTMLSQPLTMGLWALIAIVISFGVCILGVKNGVEKVTKVMMSFLIILMIVLAVNSVFLPNASEGIKFYLVPNFKSVAENGIGTSVFAAMSHAFFTLSIGIGAMELYYLTHLLHLWQALSSFLLVSRSASSRVQVRHCSLSHCLTFSIIWQAAESGAQCFSYLCHLRHCPPLLQCLKILSPHLLI